MLRQHATEPGDQGGFAGVRGGAAHHERTVHVTSPASSWCPRRGVLAPGSMLVPDLPAPRGRGRDHLTVAGGRSPVTVAGQPRIRTGVPCVDRKLPGPRTITP